MGATVAGGQAVFVGGIAQGSGMGVTVPTVDIYEPVTDKWTRGKDLPVACAQTGCASIMNQVIVAGGANNDEPVLDTVMVTSNAAKQWTTVAPLSQARTGPVAISVGKEVVLVSGGVALLPNQAGGNVSDVVDIFSFQGRTTARLSQPRVDHAVAVLGSRVFFAGGSTVWGNKNQTNSVDIFDLATNSWSRAALSLPRQDLVAASAGSKVLFAGGFNGSSLSGYSSRVDIYDQNTDSWSTSELSQARYDLAAAVWGSKIFFAGGFSPQGVTAQIDIFDVDTNLWSTAQLSHPCGLLSGVAINGMVIFAGGADANGITDVVNIIDASSF